MNWERWSWCKCYKYIQMTQSRSDADDEEQLDHDVIDRHLSVAEMHTSLCALFPTTVSAHWSIQSDIILSERTSFNIQTLCPRGTQLWIESSSYLCSVWWKVYSTIPSIPIQVTHRDLSTYTQEKHAAIASQFCLTLSQCFQLTKAHRQCLCIKCHGHSLAVMESDQENIIYRRHACISLHRWTNRHRNKRGKFCEKRRSSSYDWVNINQDQHLLKGYDYYDSFTMYIVCGVKSSTSHQLILLLHAYRWSLIHLLIIVTVTR